MRIYLQVLDYEIQKIVCDGLKPSCEWKGFLFCALDKKKFHRVSSCSNAYEIWRKLQVVYEETNQLKESKISRYTR